MRLLLLLVTVTSLGVIAAFPATLNGASKDDIEMQMRLLFSQLDKDGNDVVTLEELKSMFNKLNLQAYLNDENFKSVFNRLDMNKDRRISLEDFYGLIGSLDIMLRTVDRDNNGQLSRNEVKEAMKPYYGKTELQGLSLEDMLDADWPNMIKSLDKNDDNEISMGEVQDAVTDVVQGAIRAVDIDGDDRVSLEELKNLADLDKLPDIYMKVIDENGDGQYSYSEFKDQAEEKDPLTSIHKSLGRLNAALNSSGRTAIEWKAYMCIIGCGILVSMHI